MQRILAITPARDEQSFLPGLIQSMVAQTHKPECWIVIDDGSADQTGAILDRAAADYPWIRPHHLPRERERTFGGESVIMQFLNPEAIARVDYILRLDADLTFGPELIAMLLAKFSDERTLGIAGAVLHEPVGGTWREVRQPRFHTRGAAKMYSKACFEKIGGLQPGPGWDTIDEAQAMMLGFATRSFPDVVAYHHRPQGIAAGILRSRFNTGLTAYLIGYAPVFMLLRSLTRVLDAPPLLGSLSMLAGYLDGYRRRLPRSAPPQLIRFIRRQQTRRLLMMETLWR
jgi:biofilm PGA synthesis N-glycosyltransferase PgaC